MNVFREFLHDRVCRTHKFNETFLDVITPTSADLHAISTYKINKDNVHHGGILFVVGSAATARWSLMSVAAAIIVRYM